MEFGNIYVKQSYYTELRIQSVSAHQGLEEEPLVTDEGVSRVLPGGGLVLLYEEVGVPGEAVPLQQPQRQVGPPPRPRGAAPQQTQRVEGRHDVHQLGGRLAVLAQVVRVESIHILKKGNHSISI